MSPYPVFTKLNAKATIINDQLAFSNITGTLYNGTLGGSLNIDEALYDLFLYLKNKLPLNAILFSLYDRNQKVTRLIALAYENGAVLMDLLVPLSDAASNAFTLWLSISRAILKSLISMART